MLDNNLGIRREFEYGFEYDYERDSEFEPEWKKMIRNGNLTEISYDVITKFVIFVNGDGELRLNNINFGDILQFAWDVRRTLDKESELNLNLKVFRIILKADEAVKCLNSIYFTFMNIYIDFDKHTRKPLSHIPWDTEMAGDNQSYTLLYAAICEYDFELANLMINSGVNPNFASCETFYSSYGGNNKYPLPLQAANHIKTNNYYLTEADELITNLIKHGANLVNNVA